MEKTAVDHLFERFNMLFLFSEGIPGELQEAYDQAKQMEKEQIKDAYKTAYNYYQSAEEFYNETYGNDK